MSAAGLFVDLLGCITIAESGREELFFTDNVCLIPPASTGVGVSAWRRHMNGLIYIIGLIVVVMFILSFLGLR